MEGGFVVSVDENLNRSFPFCIRNRETSNDLCFNSIVWKKICELNWFPIKDSGS